MSHTYIIAKVIGMVGMENFRSVPYKATDAFEPVEVIFIYKLYKVKQRKTHCNKIGKIH